MTNDPRGGGIDAAQSEPDSKTHAKADAQPPSKLLSWLRLLRLPNVFTAMADVFMGYLLVSDGLTPAIAFACLLLSSSCLYLAGMVLNDVCDLERDAKERPHRPLPSGQISRRAAIATVAGLLGGGVILGAAAGFTSPDIALAWRPGVIALLLAGSVVLYDMVLKTTPAAPLLMGACRLFNVLLGMSAATWLAGGDVTTFLGYDAGQWIVAGAIGIYIMGVTLLARNEAAESHPGKLMLAVLVMMAGIGLLALYPDFFHPPEPLLIIKMDRLSFWRLLLLVMALFIVRQSVMAVMDPTPRRVQAAVKHCILSLVVLDAFIVASAREPLWGIAVLSLLIPMLALGRWVYST